MGLLSGLANAIYREYDRRIKRASLVTEYGAQHHGGHAAGHAEEPHQAEAHAAEGHEETTEEAEIVNVPRGTPVAMGEHVANEPAETTDRP